MQNVGVYLTLLVIGALIGASVVTFVTMNQNPSVEEQVKVTILGIEYETSGSVLKIELLNDAPEKNLEGNVAVFQDGNQWTSEVTWYYTGYGEAEVICDSINETQNFRITYTENSPKVTYLDREIKWKEVETSQTITFMETSELTITQMMFDTANNNITLAITNSGTSDVTISMIKVNGNTVTSGSISGTLTYAAGASATNLELTYSGGITAGNKYSVSLFTSDGTLIGSYTDTA